METSFICFVSRLDMFWIYLKFDICSVASKAAQPIVLIFQISKKFQKFEFRNLFCCNTVVFCNTISFFVTQFLFCNTVAFLTQFLYQHGLEADVAVTDVRWNEDGEVFHGIYKYG